MSDLDKKLERVLRRPGMVWMGDYDPMIEKMIIEIKQTFKEAGYMLGTEWYDRFVKEVDAIDSVTWDDAYKQHMFRAAKRASVLETE